MKHLFLLLFSSLLYSQQYSANHNENTKAIYKFELAHTKEIRENTKGDTIIAQLNFNDSGVITNVQYFESEKSEGFGKPIKVWDGLDAFIKELYPFVPVSQFNRESAGISTYLFRLPVKKDDLVKAIDFMENELPKQEALIRKKQGAEYDETKKNILPNMSFTIMVSKLELDRIKNSQKKLQGTLKYLDSGTIRLAPDCFMIFNVLNTSENGKPQHYLQYKLFKIQKDKTAMLYIKENYIDISNRKVLLKQKGNREYIKDESVIHSTETFDFEIAISFN